MYRPSFCCECGEKVIRLRWRFWHSRAFCDRCAKGLRQERWRTPALLGVLLVSSGLFAGRAMRPAPPPLIIQRVANSPLTKSDPSGASAAEQSPIVVEEIYSCGAQTRKGTPCSRRVHGAVRCWQHKGMPAMVAQEKLKVKE